MPRKLRQPSQTGFYHFITRGVIQKELFHQKRDYCHYLQLINEYRRRYRIHIYHYCLMTNHVHMLVRAKDIASLSQFSHFIQRRYAYYYQGIYGWNGQLFQGRYKSIPVERDSYLLECGRYIERNPLRARLVKNLEDYPYNSFAYYALGEVNALVTPSPMYLELGRKDQERMGRYYQYVLEDRPYEERLMGKVPRF